MNYVERAQLQDWLLNQKGTSKAELKNILVITKETEKAIYIENTLATKINGEQRLISFWYPKSQILEVEEEVTEEEEVKEEVKKVVTSGLAYYELLIEWAKEQGIKGVRKRMKGEKLYDLISLSGLEAPKEFRV